MCELIRDYICKHCAGDLYIEKKNDKTNQLKSSYKAIVYCKSCASHVEICSYSEKDFNNAIKDVLRLIGIKNKSNTTNEISITYNQYQYMNYQEAIELLNELLSKGNFTDQYGDMDDSSPYEEAINIAVKAIEKQIPKKTKNNGYCSEIKLFIGACPLCNRYNISDDDNNYCYVCGQALDWSVTQ